MNFIHEPYFPILSELFEFLLRVYEKITRKKKAKPEKELFDFLEAHGFHFEEDKE